MRVVGSLTLVRRDRVSGGVVAVREGGGKGWHEAEESPAAVSSTQQSIWRDRVKDRGIK